MRLCINQLLSFFLRLGAEDGYDRGKTTLPRWSRGRTPKSSVFEKVNRPHMNISAAYAHGYTCCIFISDENMSCGSSYTWETLLLTINEVFKLCRQNGESRPKSQPGFYTQSTEVHFILFFAPRLWIQGDNTVKELKNQTSGQMACSLLADNVFDEIGHHHLPKGHTHEDVGPMACNEHVCFDS